MARLCRPRLFFVIAIVLSTASAAWAADKFCVIEAKLDAGGAVRLGGDVVSPLPAELKTAEEGKLYGTISIVFPTGACPTADGLQSALASAFLAEPTGSSGGVRIDHLSATVEMEGTQLGKVTLKDQRGLIVSKAPFGPTGSSPFELVSVAGAAVIESELVSVPPMDLSKGKPLPGTGCSASATAGGAVTVDCSGIALTGAIVTPDAEAAIRISGSFVARGDLAGAKLVDAALFPGAPVPKETTKAAGSEQAAADTAAITAPTAAIGAAVAAPAAAGSAAAPEAAVAPPAKQTSLTSVAAPSEPSGSLGPRCTSGSSSGGSCTCEEGWTGDGCARCTSSSVCPALTGQLMSTCDKNMEYTSRTGYKGYSCKVKGGLGALVKSITGICNVHGDKLPFPDGPLGLEAGAMLNGAIPSNSFCKLVVTLSQEPANPLHCSATSCSFEEGKAQFSCAKAACGCPAKGKCIPLIQGIVNNMRNASIGIDCDSKGDCTLLGIQPRLELSCESGECTQPELPPRALPSLKAPPAKPFPVVAMVACMAPIILSILGSLGLAYVVISRRMFANGGGGRCGGGAAAGSCDGGGGAEPRRHPPRSAGGSGGSRARLLPHEMIGRAVQFVFDGIHCSVPRRSSDAAPGRAPVDGLFAMESSDGGPPTPMSIDRGGGGGGGELGASGAGGDRKVLLHGISGAIAQGEVVGVMGPSGAGKSTLLSILSGATESVGAGARIEGTVRLGGEGRRSALRKITAFVPQKDVLLPALTVEECVRYSALLRLPRSLGAEEIQERIDSVLAELGLSHVATSLVGGSASIRGVSGGERRRVTIAMALVTRPRLVIMDEPTSGLDSYTAYNLMKTAHDIAKHGRVIIMSLHQPSPDMFDSLSQVLLLAKGRLAYLGSPSGVNPSFAAAGYPCPPSRQPAEHMLHVASQGSGLAALLRHRACCAGLATGTSKGGKAEMRLSGEFARCTVGATAKAAAAGAHHKAQLSLVGGSLSVDEDWHIASAVVEAAGQAGLSPAGCARCADAPLIPPPPIHTHCHHNLHANRSSTPMPPPTPTPGATGSFSRASNWVGRLARECAVLYWRAFTNMRREPRLLLLHMLVALILGLIVGAVFFQLDSSNVGLQNRLGSMFFALALFGWTSVSVVDGLVLERELVEREVAGHYYRGGTYLLSSLVLDGLLLRTLPALLFCGLMYPMVGLLPEASRVATFMFVLATYTCTVGALTTALTALCRTSSATTLAMNIILLMWVLVGGYLVNPMSIPVWMRWIRYLSPLSFAFEVLAANEMADQYFSIKVDGFPSIGGIKGDVFLRTLGLEPSRTLQSAGALAAFYGGSLLLAFVAMSYTLWKHGGGSWRGLFCGSEGEAGLLSSHSGSSGGGDATPMARGPAAVHCGESPRSPRHRATINVQVAAMAPACLETAASARLDTDSEQLN